jgi:hypothetical protein
MFCGALLETAGFVNGSVCADFVVLPHFSHVLIVAVMCGFDRDVATGVAENREFSACSAIILFFVSANTASAGEYLS